MINIVILASGRGSNAQAIQIAAKKAHSQFKISAIISDNPRSQAIANADKNNIQTHIADGNNIIMEKKLTELIQKYQPDLICLAGFMRILSADFVNAHKNKIINIHPSLLPKYKGLNTHKRAIQAGDKIHGATTHFVTEKLDDGPIIAQCQINILPNDTPQSLAERLLPHEHKLYVETIAKIAAQKIAQQQN